MPRPGLCLGFRQYLGSEGGDPPFFCVLPGERIVSVSSDTFTKERERFIIARLQTKLWRKDEKETRVLCTSYYVAYIYIYIYKQANALVV